MQISDIVYSAATINFDLYDINVLSIDLKESKLSFHILLADYIKYLIKHPAKIKERNIINYEYEIRCNVGNISFYALLTEKEKENFLKRSI